MIEAGRKKARLGLNPYNDWVAREGLLVHEGVACDLLTAETRHWPRYGVKGAAVHLRGRGDFCNLFLLDIPPGASTEPQHHLYEEVMYVVEGRGSTQLEFADGSTHSFEWQPRSMFAIPLNATYRLHNADGKNRAVIGTTTSLPLMMTSAPITSSPKPRRGSRLSMLTFPLQPGGPRTLFTSSG